MASLARTSLPKRLLLSPIYVWLNRSIKNYTAQKHLEVINTHRQKALDTFDTICYGAAGENRETRDAVLLAATDAIFRREPDGLFINERERFGQQKSHTTGD